MNDDIPASPDRPTADQAQPHYWSLEHYGFDDDQEAASVPGPARRQRTAGPAARRGLTAFAVSLGLLLTGTGAYAAVQAADAPPQQGALTQQVDPPGNPDDGQATGFRGGGPGPGGGRGGDGR